jgi:hypothetical protein
VRAENGLFCTLGLLARHSGVWGIGVFAYLLGEEMGFV